MDYQQPLTVAIEAARVAGALLREEFHRPGGPRGAGGHAEMDAIAERAIQERLLGAFPWRYLGEELGRVDRGDDLHLWLVDPNDGTTSYLRGRRGCAVSIALLRDGLPVLGVVYAFAYPDDEGDLIAWAEGCSRVTRNGSPVEVDLSQVSLEDCNPPQVLLVSPGADRRAPPNARCAAPARFVVRPSIAYRLALSAVGEAVAGLSLHGPGAWDYAGGHALLRGAGGTLVDEQGRPITYTKDGRSTCHWCFGGPPAVVEALRKRPWQEALGPMRRRPSPPFDLIRAMPGQTVADPGRLSRAQGCLLGQLAGDSLGGLVEFQSAAAIRARYPRGIRDLVDGGTWHNLAGQPTDDSELALMLARTLVHMGQVSNLPMHDGLEIHPTKDARYHTGAALDAYVHWWQDPETFDRGSTIGRALSAAARGTTTAERLQLVERHASRSSQSNGSLMRVSPLGIFGAYSPGTAAAWAREDSRLTHPNPVCQDSCGVYVAAIATAVGRGCSPRECYEAALEEAQRSAVEPTVREALLAAANSPPDDYLTHQGWVLVALQNAFYQLLHAPGFEEGVVDTVMRGGDTDTTAAIAGALLGAVHGRKAIPGRWIRAILSCRPLRGTDTEHPRSIEYWPVDALELAESLLVAGNAGEEQLGVL